MLVQTSHSHTSWFASALFHLEKITVAQLLSIMWHAWLMAIALTFLYKLLLTKTVPGLPDTIFAQPNPVWVSGYDTYKFTDVSSQGWIHESRSLSSSTTRNFPLRRILHVSLNQLEWLIIVSWAARPLKPLGIFFFPLLGF